MMTLQDSLPQTLLPTLNFAWTLIHRQGRLSELRSENSRIQRSNHDGAAAEREMDTEMVTRSWTEEGHQGEKEMEKLCDQRWPCEPEEEGQGMLVRFLRGLQPVSHVYWED